MLRRYQNALDCVRMELRHLQAFVTVAELRSFRRAAVRLHLSQPPLSRQIQALEAELGVRLLERGSRREVTLTEAGQVFLADAKKALEVLDGARQKVREFDQRTRHRLVIGNYSELSVRVLSRWLQAFQEEQPEVEVSIVELNGLEGLAALQTGRVQIGLVSDHGLSVGDALRAETVLEVRLIALLPAGHRLMKKRGTEIGLEELARETIFYKRREHAPCYSQRLPELFERVAVEGCTLRAVDGMSNVLAMVAAGYGVAVVPDVLGDTLPPKLRTKLVRLPASVPPLQLFTVWMPEAATRPMRGFLEVTRRLSEFAVGAVDGRAKQAA